VTETPLRSSRRSAGLGATTVLVTVVVLFSLVTELAWFIAVPIALVGAFASVALRRSRGAASLELAAAPSVVAVGALAGVAPATPIAALLGGGSALAILAWLAEDPTRAPGGLRRARPTILVAALAFAVAWGSALLLPPAAGAIGIAGALLVVALVLIAAVLGRPRLLQAPPGSTV